MRHKKQYSGNGKIASLLIDKGLKRWDIWSGTQGNRRTQTRTSLLGISSNLGNVEEKRQQVQPKEGISNKTQKTQILW